MNKQTASWERIFSQMDDIQVFYLYRLYIKDISTPFHKPKLITELKKFTQKHVDAMISLLDEEDISFITFIMLFSSADYASMHAFFKAVGFSSFAIQKKLMNLQERMIVFFHEGALHINPLLLKRVSSYADLRTLFIDWKSADPAHSSPVPAVSAEFSDSAASADSASKKKIDMHESFWFSLNTCIGLFSLLELKPQPSIDPASIFTSEFLEKSPASVPPRKEAAESFIRRVLSSLSLDTYPFSSAQKAHIDLLMHLPESICFGMLLLSGVLPKHRAADKSMLSAFLHFTAAVSQLQLEKKELVLLFGLLNNDTDLTFNDCELIIERLIELNILTSYDAGTGSRKFTVNSACAAQLKRDETSRSSESAGPSTDTADAGIQSAQPAAILSNDYTLHIPKEVPCSQWYAVYTFAVYQKSDQVALFHITKKSVLLAVDRGLSAENILQYVESLTGKVPESVAVSIKQWEKDFLEIQMFRGTVLKAEGRKKYIIDHHPEIQKHMLLKLTDGVYLINPQTEEQLRDVLRSSGIEFLPSTQFSEYVSESSEEHGGSIDDSLGESLRSLYDLSMKDIMHKTYEHLTDTESGKTELRAAPLNSEAAEAYYEKYKKEIDAQYTGDELDELTDRLQNRIILSSGQLHSCSHVKTRFEANGFNYQSKIQLIKQVISNSGELLEIQMKPNRESVGDAVSAASLSSLPENAADTAFLFRPMQLAKGTAENPADSVSGYMLPGGETSELSVSKIFRIVRLKKPLYLPEMDTHSR